MGRLARAAFRIHVALALVLLFFRVASRFDIEALWDDAYIFQRYALNLLNGDGLAWNPGGEPTYGFTAPLFLVPVTLLRWAFPNPSVAAILASTLCGVLFVVLTAALVWWHGRGSKLARRITLALLLYCIAGSITSEHFVSGMDTTFGLAYLAVFLGAAAAYEERPGRARAVVLGVLGGLSFGVRPELVAFALAVPLGMMLERERRRGALVALGVTALVLALHLGVNAVYFHSVLPLPFYAKGTDLYQGALRKAYRGVTGQELANFTGSYWPLLLAPLFEPIGSLRRWWRVASGLEKGTLAALLACVLYHWLLVVPVMAQHQRFFHPAVVPAALLTARALARWEEALRGARERIGAALAGAAVLVAFGLVWLDLFPAFTEKARDYSWSLRKPLKFKPEAHAATPGPMGYWYRLDAVSKMPDDLVIATTEVGFLSALNPHKKIVDMAGLNERAFALRPFDANVLLAEYAPDLIYMPHDDYQPMISALLDNERFKAEYDHYDKRRLGTKSFGIAVRRDGRHAAELIELVEGKPKPKNQKRGK